MMIFLFHSEIHLNCDYGILTNYIHMGAIFMTGFFMLSGYVLYMTYQNKDLTKIVNIKKFYLKRIIGILPLYYFIAITYVVFYGKETVLENILLAPIEILCLQSTFSTIFSVTHNGGTWFISCLMLAYIIYPFIQEMIKQLNNKESKTIMVIIIGILLISPFVVWKFHTNGIYENPFFRCLEFLIGVLLCKLLHNGELSNSKSWIYTWKAFVMENMFLIVAVTLMVYYKISVGNYMLYSWIALPLFVLMFATLSKVKWNFRGISKLMYFSKISYAFFLAQYFTYSTTKFAMESLGINGNVEQILISFSICFIVTNMMHYFIELPSAVSLKKRFDI